MSNKFLKQRRPEKVLAEKPELDELKIELNQFRADLDLRLDEVQEETQNEIAGVFNSIELLKEDIDSLEIPQEETIVKNILSQVPQPEKVDVRKLEKDILSKIPKPEKIDEVKLVKKVLKAIPENKASLKIIQEKFETNPMSVIDKILSLGSRFKLKTENIDGLEQTISAFRNQISARGYVHGGGDTVVAGANITIVTNSQGKKVISSASGSSLILETNGVANGDQTLLNLINGTGINIADDNAGGITISAVGQLPDYTAPDDTQITLRGGITTINDTDGHGLFVQASAGLGIGQGGNSVFNAGAGGDTGNGGAVIFASGAGGPTSGNSGDMSFGVGTAVDGNGGNVSIQTGGGATTTGADRNGGIYQIVLGRATNAGIPGKLWVTPKSGDTGGSAIFDFDFVNTSDKTLIVPNKSGTLALTSDLPASEAVLINPLADSIVTASFAASTNGLYRLSYFANVITRAGSPLPVSLIVTVNNSSSILNLTSDSLDLSINSFIQGTFVFDSDATPITYAFDTGGGFADAMVYFSLFLELISPS